MSLFTAFLIISTLLAPQLSHAMSCNDIFQKAKPTTKKGGKSGCVMIEHTIGVERGSSESIYECKGTKYKLVTSEDYSCTATIVRKN